MKLLWTLLKVAIVLVCVSVAATFLLGTALTVLGALFGVAVVLLRVAVVGLLVYGAFRLFKLMFGRSKPAMPERVEVRELPRPDPYYESAMRDLDREMRSSP